MPDKYYFFVSYARSDYQIVKKVIDELKAFGIGVWQDVEDLLPGHSWKIQLEKALLNASGMLIFVSNASMQSDFVRAELQTAIDKARGLIIPIILERVENLPSALQEREWIDLSGSPQNDDIALAAEKIFKSIEQAGPLEKQLPLVTEGHVGKVAATLASETRKASEKIIDENTPPDSVFIVHGHDIEFLDEVEGYVKNLGIKPVVLTRIGSYEQSLFQKFLRYTENTRFAIVLMTADDMGASRRQYDADDVREKALQFRARQNVILELGFFYGLLGWERVFLVFKKPTVVFPNFERPSDLGGIELYEADNTNKWKNYLKERLQEAGFLL